jgi:formylglycine-generating enzyme
MVLVDGEYCTHLELTCRDSWYAKWNDKTICNAFEEPSRCTGDRVKKRFCMDAYEYPNERGQRPRVGFNFIVAQHLCEAQGKRVCTETEWTTACEGPKYKPYPYGYVRDPKACNGDRPYIEPAVLAHDKKGLPILAFASRNPSVYEPEIERLWQGVESGSQSRCVSDYGVWDMAGNADELASSEMPPPTSRYDNVTTGGPWLYGVRNQCRPKIYTHNEGFSYYYLSTRCCAEADGKPTDPRSPKQIARGEKWRP